jgi:adenine-specific DNA methylase
MDSFDSLFGQRQLLALTTISDLVVEAGKKCAGEGDKDFASAVQELLAMNLSKLADYNSALTTWLPQASQETVAHTFARPAISMVWDFIMRGAVLLRMRPSIRCRTTVRQRLLLTRLTTMQCRMQICLTFLSFG